jgi:hypothetical protein
VPLAAEFVRAFVPVRVWPELRAQLVDSGILEWDPYYRPATDTRAGQCHSFRLAPGYRTAEIVPHELRHPELVARIISYRERERAKIANPVHVALRRWVGRLEVLPDAPAGCPALDHIAAGDCWFSVCGQGRVHSPATNLDRKYRPFVRLAGRELVSVDVSAAQPLLLAAALAEPSPVFPGPGREDRHAPRGSEGRARKAKPIVVQDSSGGANDDGFFRDARTGVLYDRLAAVWRISRDEAKLAYMVLVYGFPRRFNRDRQREFADLYPATWAKLASLALGEPDGEVARMVQRAESGLMIGRVAARFMREFRTAPVLTCHDALLVPPEFAPAAETIIGNEWERVYGYRPRIKVSPWT